MIPFVMKERCSTCIFRPGNLMNLAEGRLEQLVAETDAKDENVRCHQSDGLVGKLRCEAWCRGSVDRRPGDAVRLMRELGILQEITEDGQLVLKTQ
jgi:hypothetical protein